MQVAEWSGGRRRRLVSCETNTVVLASLGLVRTLLPPPPSPPPLCSPPPSPSPPSHLPSPYFTPPPITPKRARILNAMAAPTFAFSRAHFLRQPVVLRHLRKAVVAPPRVVAGDEGPGHRRHERHRANPGRRGPEPRCAPQQAGVEQQLAGRRCRGGGGTRPVESLGIGK